MADRPGSNINFRTSAADLADFRLFKGDHRMKRPMIAVLAATAALAVSTTAQAQISDDVVKIGVTAVTGVETNVGMKVIGLPSQAGAETIAEMTDAGKMTTCAVTIQGHVVVRVAKDVAEWLLWQRVRCTLSPPAAHDFIAIISLFLATMQMLGLVDEHRLEPRLWLTS